MELAILRACSAFSSGLRSALNGPPELRSPQSFGLTTRAAKAAHFCKPDIQSEASSLPAFGSLSARQARERGATCFWSAYCRHSSHSGSGATFRNRNAGSNRMSGGKARMRNSAAAWRLHGEDAAIVRFTLIDMFAEPAVRSRLILTFIMSLCGDDRLLGRFKLRAELCRSGCHRRKASPLKPALGGIGRPGAEHRRLARVHQLRLPGRRVRPQDDDIFILSALSDPDPDRLSVGEGDPPAAAGLRGLWILHPGHLLLDCSLAAGAVSDAHARHSRGLHFQHAATDLCDRAA